MLINPETGLKLLSLLGFTNLLFLLLVISSCRCMGMNKFTMGLMHSPRYLKFFNLHCYFWYCFLASVALHATLAIYLFGIPFLR